MILFQNSIPVAFCFSDGVVTSEEADAVVKKLKEENKKKLKDTTDVEKKSQSASDSDSSESESGINMGESFQDLSWTFHRKSASKY